MQRLSQTSTKHQAKLRLPLWNLHLSPLSESTDGGDRTHTSVRIPDFESSASANSATSAFPAPNEERPNDEPREKPSPPVAGQPRSSRRSSQTEHSLPPECKKKSRQKPGVIQSGSGQSGASLKISLWRKANGRCGRAWSPVRSTFRSTLPFLRPGAAREILACQANWRWRSLPKARHELLQYRRKGLRDGRELLPYRRRQRKRGGPKAHLHRSLGQRPRNLILKRRALKGRPSSAPLKKRMTRSGERRPDAAGAHGAASVPAPHERCSTAKPIGGGARFLKPVMNFCGVRGGCVAGRRPIFIVAWGNAPGISFLNAQP
jgi:hypothetical protein